MDFDALGAAEGESWVYKGHTVLEMPPDWGMFCRFVIIFYNYIMSN